MKSQIIDKSGVVEAGPDEPALVAAEVREGNTAVRYVSGGLLGASAGPVSHSQAGILPTGPLRVSDAMVDRGFLVARRLVADPTLERGDVRAILEAALAG